MTIFNPKIDSYLKIIIILFSLVLIILLSVYFHGRRIILDNWSKYRCNPLIIPISGLFGQPTGANMKKCMFLSFKSFFGFLLQPFSYIIKIIEKIIGGLFQDLNIFRTFLKPIRLFILNATQMFYNKINQFTTTIVYSFAKMRNSMKRMAALFRLTLYTLEVMQFSMKSIWDGPIGKVSRSWGKASKPISKFFCFLPGTLFLDMDDKSHKIQHIQLGQYIIGGRVIGKAQFYIKDIPIYRWKGTWVTGTHLVYHNKCWVRVEEVTKSVSKYTGEIYCLTTTNHTLVCPNGVVWSDFEEVEDTSQHPWMLHYTLRQLSPQSKYVSYPFTYQTIGFYQNSYIERKRVGDYQIGDLLDNSPIIGIYQYVNSDPHVFYLSHKSNNILVGGRQLCQYQDTWIPISQHPRARSHPHNTTDIYISFITQSQWFQVDSIPFTNIYDSLDTHHLIILNRMKQKYLNHINNTSLNHQIVEVPNTT